jgi:hypothetical protein
VVLVVTAVVVVVMVLLLTMVHSYPALNVNGTNYPSTSAHTSRLTKPTPIPDAHVVVMVTSPESLDPGIAGSIGR